MYLVWWGGNMGVSGHQTHWSTLKIGIVYPVWIMPQFGLFREYEQRVK